MSHGSRLTGKIYSIASIGCLKVTQYISQPANTSDDMLMWLKKKERETLTIN